MSYPTATVSIAQRYVTFFSVLKCSFDFSLCDREEAAQAQAPNLNAGIKTRLL